VKILISGSREFDDYLFVKEVLSEYINEDVVVIHGAARGADYLGGKAAKKLGFKVEEFPADWSAGKRMGTVRNSEMLAQFPDLALFFFVSGIPNAGTRDAAKKAKQIDVPSRYFVDAKEVSFGELKRTIYPF